MPYREAELIKVSPRPDAAAGDTWNNKVGTLAGTIVPCSCELG